MLASSPELEDPLPPKMPRFRVALSPSAPEIVPFWGSGEAGFGREDRDSGFFELEEASRPIKHVVRPAADRAAMRGPERGGGIER